MVLRLYYPEEQITAIVCVCVCIYIDIYMCVCVCVCARAYAHVCMKKAARLWQIVPRTKQRTTIMTDPD